MLRDLDLKRRYRSSHDELVRDLFTPCLSNSTRYDRAVGFYSSAALSAAAEGLSSFIERGGQMRLVASPHLSRGDLDSIVEGHERRESAVTQTVTSELTAELPDPVAERLGLLGWLIEKRRLEIKLAAMRQADGTAGIYHEKVGVFGDQQGDRVAFLGSANESKGGLRSNFESVVVFRSWVVGEGSDAEGIAADFEALWEDRTPSLRVFAFPEAAQEALIRLAPPDAGALQSEEPSDGEKETELASQSRAPRQLQVPPGVELRNYQEDALMAWLRNEGRGVLAMATGTGKTYTALAAASRVQSHLAAQSKPFLCVIVCPYQHLVRQWADAVREFGADPVLCYRSASEWREPLAERLQALRTGTTTSAVAIATNSTFCGVSFTRMATEFLQHTLLIADEAHNLGAERSRIALTDAYRYRLALSATPERAYDEEGSEFLAKYFGGIVFNFDLEDAIEAGVLTPYEYFPRLVYLEDEELDSYLELTAKIARASYAGDESVIEGPLLTLLVQRARIVGSARGKLSALAEAVRPVLGTTHNLFYCGDGKVDAGDTTAERQLDAVVKLLGVQLGMRVQSYTHENFADERDQLRERFASGDLQGLVAIRCLDEGVDIPETRRAFILASSTNPRQFVQRRGRVLRRAPGKEAAEIHDFLVLPPLGSVAQELWQIERRLAERELERIALFAKLATNRAQALHSLLDVRERYGLLHIG
jgi:DNA phosphorothioation system restriction enzyme